MTTLNIPLDYRHYRVEFQIKSVPDDPASHYLALFANECLRKDRLGASTLYVWTNVELEWEEHHLIEARLHKAVDGQRQFVVTANKEEILRQAIDLAPA